MNDHVSWHWQDRFDIHDPEQVFRKQILHLTRSISFDKWLKLKKADRCTLDYNTQNLEPHCYKKGKGKEMSIEEFNEWKRSKKKRGNMGIMNTVSNSKLSITSTEDRQPTHYFKPESLHVNIPGPCKSKKLPKTSNSCESKRSSNCKDEASTAYNAWKLRKALEKRVMKKMEIQKEKEKHAINKMQHMEKWKKKDIVAAYSTNICLGIPKK